MNTSPAIPAVDVEKGEVLSPPHVYGYFDRPSCPGLVTGSDSPVQSQFADDCEICSIIQRLGVGLCEDVRPGGCFGDFGDFPDFRQIQDTYAKVSEDFEALPANLRKEFGYDPANLMEFLADPANKERAVQLGFIVPPAPSEPVPVPPSPVNQEPEPAVE